MALPAIWCVVTVECSVAQINCVVTLEHPRRRDDDDCDTFVDALIPCYFNPAISPIVCSMRYSSRGRKNIQPGTYHMVATVQRSHFSSLLFILTLTS